MSCIGRGGMHIETNGLDIRIKISGPAFENNKAVMQPTASILSNYEEALSYCLQESAVGHGFKKELAFNNSVRLKGVASGCLEIHTYLDVFAALMPLGVPALGLAMNLTPEVLKYGWDLFVAACKFIAIAVKYFQDKKKPINVEVHDSPGAFVLVVVGSDGTTTGIAISPDVMRVAKAIHPRLEELAKTVQKGQATDIHIGAEYEGAESFHVNSDNMGHFKQVTQEAIDENIIEINAHIYRINTKKKEGGLELVDDPERGSIPFAIEAGEISEYVDSLKETESTFLAKREMSINALGEIKVKRLLLLGTPQNQ
jgi:hypothetical protein